MRSKYIIPVAVLIGAVMMFSNGAQGSKTEASSEMEFYNSSIHYSVTRSKTVFSISDDMGMRKLEVKKCNRKIADQFWADVERKLKSLQAASPQGKAEKGKAWVRYEGLKFTVYEFESAVHFSINYPITLTSYFPRVRDYAKEISHPDPGRNFFNWLPSSCGVSGKDSRCK